MLLGENLRQGDDPALLRRLDGIGAHAVEVHAGALGAPREDRAQRTRPHLHGLLHHVVEPGMLEGREHVEEIGRRCLLPHALHGDQFAALASLGPDLRAPLPVASVEHQHDFAGAQAQDVQEIVRLATVERQTRPGGERRIEEETGCLEIVSGHGAGLVGQGNPLWDPPDARP